MGNHDSCKSPETTEEKYRRFGYTNCAELGWLVRVAQLPVPAKEKEYLGWLRIEVTQHGDTSHRPRQIEEFEVFESWLSTSDYCLPIFNAIWQITKPKRSDGYLYSYLLFIAHDGTLLDHDSTSDGTPPKEESS